MSNVLESLRANWRRAAVVVGVLAGVFAAGGLAARRFLPRVEVHEVTHSEIVYQDRWNVAVVSKEAEVKYQTRETVVYVYGQTGNVETKTETREAASEQRTADVATDASGVSRESATVDVARTTVTNPAPRWHAAVGAGVRPLRGADLVAYGALDYRVAGPLTLGAWVALPVGDLPSTAVGLSLGVTF